MTQMSRASLYMSNYVSSFWVDDVLIKEKFFFVTGSPTFAFVSFLTKQEKKIRLFNSTTDYYRLLPIITDYYRLLSSLIVTRGGRDDEEKSMCGSEEVFAKPVCTRVPTCVIFEYHPVLNGSILGL